MTETTLYESWDVFGLFDRWIMEVHKIMWVYFSYNYLNWTSGAISDRKLSQSDIYTGFIWSLHTYQDFFRWNLKLYINKYFLTEKYIR